jgi:hypothetical protein
LRHAEPVGGMTEVPLLGDGHEEAEMTEQIHGNMKAGSTDKIGFVAGSGSVSDEERTCGRPTRAGTPCRGDRVLLPENWLSRKKDGPGNDRA